MMTAHNTAPHQTHDITARRAHLLAEATHAYDELRRHLHDPWAGYCPVCEIPGPCPRFLHWLDRLAALEAAEIELDPFQDNDSGTANTTDTVGSNGPDSTSDSGLDTPSGSDPDSPSGSGPDTPSGTGEVSGT